MSGELAQFLPYAVPANFLPYSEQDEDWDQRAYVTYNRDVFTADGTFSFTAIAGAKYFIESRSFFDPNLIVFDANGDLVSFANDRYGSYGTDFIFIERDIEEELFIWAGWDQGFASTNKYVTLEILVDVDTINDDRFISGTSDSDMIVGGLGDDRLSGFEGNDTIDGGGGLDTAVFTGVLVAGFDFTIPVSSANFTLTLSPDEVTISDRRVDGLGTDTLTDIDFLDFGYRDDRDIFDLRDLAGTSKISDDNLSLITELYIAYFNRAPDAIGLQFWVTAFTNGTSFEEMATLFVDQEETRATYPSGTSNTDFVTEVYGNVLGRIPDQDGFNFWVDMLNRSSETGVSRDHFILEVLNGVQDGSPDRIYLDSKVDIGAYFAVHRGMSNIENATATMALFDGTQSSIEQAVSAIDSFYQQALDPMSGEFLIQVVGILENPFEAA